MRLYVKRLHNNWLEHRTLRKSLVICTLFIVLLSAIRIIWIQYIIPTKPALAVNGQLDLSNLDSQSFKKIALEGEWNFYPSQLLEPTSDLSAANKTMATVPVNLANQFPLEQIKYGTYHLKVILPDDFPPSIRLFFPKIANSGEIYVNGELVHNVGKVGRSSNEAIAKVTSTGKTIQLSETYLDIFVQYANFHPSKRYGLAEPVIIGNHSSLLAYQTILIIFEAISMVFLLIHAFYAALLLLYRKNKVAILAFIGFSVVSIMTIGFDDSRVLTLIWDIPHEYVMRLYQFSYGLLGVLLFVYLLALLGISFRHKFIYILIAISVIYSLSQLILPFELSYIVKQSSYIILFMQYAFIMFTLGIAVRKRVRGSLLLLCTSFIIVSNTLWGIYKYTLTDFIPYYPFDLWIAFILFSAYWFYMFNDSLVRNQKLSEELIKADSMKDQFLANTSHELRNPLQAVLSVTQTTMERHNEMTDEQKFQQLKLTLSIGRRMTHILDDLMDFTRLKNSQINLQIRSINIMSLVTGVIDMLRYLIEEKGIELRIEIPDRAQHVMADEQRIVQVMFNLIHNAIKFTAEGTIIVRVTKVGNYAKVEIIDTGIGMNEDTRRRIFSPYEQGSDQKDINGIGLGLSICKQLIELHNSELHVHTKEGKGSIFYFTLELGLAVDIDETISDVLPAQLISTVASDFTDMHHLALGVAEQAVDEQHKEQINILLVDDDRFNLKIVKNILTTHYYNVDMALNGAEALDKLYQKEWHLVISDVMMPNMSGYELSKQIRTRFSRSELPILLLTARTEPEDIFTGFISGANDYIRKPLEAIELRARVHALTEMQQSARLQSRMEAAWLQAQIQPHFIFNTLNAISALSNINQERMKELLEVFSSYLRLSYNMNNAERLIELSKEIELVTAYLFIEKQRFDDRLQIEWHLDPTLDNLLIPPLTIQPLVENALKHGIMKKLKGGIVSISVIDQGNTVKIAIADNGVGMKDEVLHRLNQLQPGRIDGIGVLNTNRRLKHVYGTGLHIKSELGKGTTVSFLVNKH